MTRAPSPCSANSSSEASAKEEATQGKPTDDARLTEIRRHVDAGDYEHWVRDSLRVLLREIDRLLAALRAAQSANRSFAARVADLEAERDQLIDALRRADPGEYYRETRAALASSPSPTQEPADEVSTRANVDRRTDVSHEEPADGDTLDC